MVSTRGVKLKFYEGERVLCYEPDPTKAKVLYDSKVLDVVVNKDNRGRKTVEYLIHFQGWNSSWDRCVREEYVLKDTPENRQLQKDLAEKSQLQLGAYLYRRERKKHTRNKVSEPVTQSSEDGSSGSPAHMDTEESSSSSEEDSSVDEDAIPIELTQDLRNILEHDYHTINNRNKLMKLPTEPTVITILETYWKHYAMSLLCGLNEKPHTRHRTPSKVRPEDVQRNKPYYTLNNLLKAGKIANQANLGRMKVEFTQLFSADTIDRTSLNICKEMLDGLRIYFDFTLKDLLLYKKEQNQVDTSHAKFLSSIPSIKQEITVKTELEDLEYAHLPNMEADDEVYNNHDGEGHHSNNIGQRSRRRGLRSSRSLDTDTNGIVHEPVVNVRTSTSSNSSDVPGPMAKILSWRLLPDHVYSQQPLPPSLIYGATHLLRLLVKLPELLNDSNMIENKLKVLQGHLDSFIDFLNHHKEWYGDKFYIE